MKILGDVRQDDQARFEAAVLAIEAYVWAFDPEDVYDETMDLIDEVVEYMIDVGRELSVAVSLIG